MCVQWNLDTNANSMEIVVTKSQSVILPPTNAYDIILSLEVNEHCAEFC